MKILLAACNAKYIHSNLAVYNLKAYAKDCGGEIVLREYTVNQQKDEILKDIYLEKPEVVCMSCYIWNISFVRELSGDLSKLLPEAVFWAGGPEVSFDAENFLEENPWFTGVMVGEGEETFLELAGYYAQGRGSLPAIKGIVWQEKGRLRQNGWRETMDLSRVPFAYSYLEDFKNRIIYYESSRGCPFSCSYCLSSVDKKLRFRELALVKRELQFFMEREAPQIKFVDRTFNCRHEHAMEIWRFIKEHDNGVTNFHFEISADLLNEEELELMETMRPGLIQLEIGVQSTNPETLAAIHRTMNLEKLKQTVHRIRRFQNIHQHLDLIAGLPYEDYGSFARSFNEVYAMKPQQLQLGFLKVLKGSEMKEMAQEYGICYKAEEPYEVLSTAWLDYGDIIKLKMVESMVEVYYNSGQFQKTIDYLEAYFTDAFSFYEALGRFYEENGYDRISHSRMSRYELLLEFLKGYPQIPVEEAADKMIFDLYLRENMKSRLSFAPEQKSYEKAVWEYRRREKIPKTAHIEVLHDGRAFLFDYTKRDFMMNNAAVKEITRDVDWGA